MFKCLSHHLESCIPKAQNAGVRMNIFIPFLYMLLRLGPLIDLVFGRCLGRKSLAKNVLLARQSPPHLHANMHARGPLPRQLTVAQRTQLWRLPLLDLPPPSPLFLCWPRAGRAWGAGDRRARVSRCCSPVSSETVTRIYFYFHYMNNIGLL